MSDEDKEVASCEVQVASKETKCKIKEMQDKKISFRLQVSG